MSKTATHRTRSVALPSLFRAVIFLSAFLLFQVQLILAKFMLPWFGGSAGVWTTSMLFFQAELLAGYGYAHWIGSRAWGTRLHRAMLFVSVMLLAAYAVLWRAPIMPGLKGLLPTTYPAAGVLLFLLMSVGVPFFLLAATSPLLQLSYSRLGGAEPYKLYAFSNLGSLAGLLTYPVMVEPMAGLQVQGWLWAVGYLACAAGIMSCVRPPGDSATQARQAAGKPVSMAQAAWWIGLAAVGSLLLLATTNFLTQDVAAVPLLWVIPLVLYLVSFVAAFGSHAFYQRRFVFPAVVAGVPAMIYILLLPNLVTVKMEIWVSSAVLLIITFFCHGELARSKPAPESLTAFYVLVAAGGVLGSAVVALLAPRLFPEVWEYQCGLAVALLLVFAILIKEQAAGRVKHWVAGALAGALALLTLAAIPANAPRRQALVHDGGRVFALYAAGVLIFLAVRRVRGRAWIPAAKNSLWLASCVLATIVLWYSTQLSVGRVIHRSRNFYGVISVEQGSAPAPFGDFYAMYSGRILHGLQLRKKEYRRSASTYYQVYSGVAFVLRYHPRRWNTTREDASLRVALVGLGAGTTMVHAQPGDYFRIYEINPAVVALSRGPDPYFSNLRDCVCQSDVVLGDGRVSLQDEADRGETGKFDVIVLDAFSGDAIPVHLLTREAFELYLHHARDEHTVIAVHITNGVLNLEPIVARIAQELNLEAMRIETPNSGAFINASTWVLLTRQLPMMRVPEHESPNFQPAELGRPGALWTDSYSNILSVIR